MNGASKSRILKALLFMILLLVFFFLFFLQVVTQYSEKLTNTATTTKKSELVEAPAFSICTYWRDSIMKKYNITPMNLSIPPDNDTNLPLNSTVRSIFKEITFQLNENFFIAVSSDLSKPIPLKIGMNEIKGEEENIHMYEVKNNPTLSYGMCYVIIPKQLFMKPFQDTLIISIAKNITSENEDMNKILVQISSKDTFNTINDEMSGLENPKEKLEFTSESNGYLSIQYTEEDTEYIKECSDLAFFKCYAEKVAISRDFNCSKKCIPYRIKSMMENIEHNLTRCLNDFEEYCMAGIQGYKTFKKLKSTCLKQCRVKSSTVKTHKVASKNLYQLGDVQLDVWLTMSPEIKHYKEYLIYDGLGMFGSIGGSLGLFLGFSLFDSLSMLLDIFLKKLNFFQS